MHNQETGVVVVGSVVVRARCDSDALTVGESVHSVLTDLVASDHNLQLIHFEEFVNDV